jgi:signal transduction histidine kinase
MRLSLWPQSLFGRLIAASIVALLLAQLASLVFVARERERFILQGSVREWSRRIAEVTTMLQGMDDTERAAVVTRLSERPLRFGHRGRDVLILRDGLFPAPDLGFREGPGGPEDALGPPFHGPGSPPGGREEGRHRGAGPARGAEPTASGTERAPLGPERTAPSGERMTPQDSKRAMRAAERGGPGAAPAASADPAPRDTAPGRPGAQPSTSDAEPASARGSGHPPPGAARSGPLGPAGPPGAGGMGPAGLGSNGPVVPFSKAGDLEGTFEQQLRMALGEGFEVHVARTADPAKKAISISGPLFSEPHDSDSELYDATVKFPDGYTALFRVTRLARGAPLPRGLFMNLALLVVVMSVALFATARSITRPLSELATAADNVGRHLRQPKIAERGARELRNAARAFNTMQDRLQRYLDSRSRVLAAMSHDLKTPLTRLRLQVEMLDDSAAQTRIGKQLDEMESMVHGALALFRGLDDNEAFTPLDINEMLATLQSEFAEMSAKVSIEGRATRSILGKPQALRRCLTNLIQNAVKFGSQATVLVEDGSALVIRVRDDGPGIPESELERVFEPFYRLESSRNRDTGGSGLGLSIARDVVQAHGGSLVLANLPLRGLEAVVTLPRA